MLGGSRYCRVTIIISPLTTEFSRCVVHETRKLRDNSLHMAKLIDVHIEKIESE